MSNSGPVDVKTVQLIEPLEEGLPGPEHFRIVSNPTTWEALTESVPEGGVLVQLLVISADPYLRARIKPAVASAGKIMEGFVAGRIAATRSDKWAVGDLFGCHLPFTSVQTVGLEHISTLWSLTGKLTEATISHGIGVLGMPGSTAYAGLEVLSAREGDTVFVSGAAGAVGGLVGMLAKSLHHSKVIGSCGGPEKAAFIKEKYGFDHAIDYKTIRNKEEMVAALKAVAPDGIDTYFDNVGGFHLEAALEVLRPGGRVAICGQIQEYNNKDFTPVSWFPMKMIYTQQRISGFLCFDWLYGKKGNFHEDMARYVQEGRVPCIEETFFDGIESWPLAFQALFTGANTGKVVVRL